MSSAPQVTDHTQPLPRTADGGTGRAEALAARLRPGVLLAFRLVIATLFVLHPATMLAGGPPSTLMLVASVVEIAAIALVAVGLATRTAALLLAGMMAYAFFVVHLPGGWSWLENGGEPAALYCWVFLLLAVVGPGPLSLDARRAR